MNDDILMNEDNTEVKVDDTTASTVTEEVSTAETATEEVTESETTTSTDDTAETNTDDSDIEDLTSDDNNEEYVDEDTEDVEDEEDNTNEDEIEDDEPTVPSITSGTIVRTILLAVSVINFILTATGHSPLPFDNEDINVFVSTVFQVVMSIITWWKDNDFTVAARLRKAKS